MSRPARSAKMMGRMLVSEWARQDRKTSRLRLDGKEQYDPNHVRAARTCTAIKNDGARCIHTCWGKQHVAAGLCFQHYEEQFGSFRRLSGQAQAAGWSPAQLEAFIEKHNLCG